MRFTIFVQGYDIRLVWNSRLHKVSHYQQQLGCSSWLRHWFASYSRKNAEFMSKLWYSPS